jgi:hypothetical protein
MEKFKPQKMVGWFDVGQLASTGMRAVLSSIFGSYADKRETIASISKPEIYEEYAAEGELWLDYISDVGDGFDSSFTMAKLIGSDSITVKSGNSTLQLPRGRLVVFGGDQVYPAPSREEYQNRFIGPMDAAAPWTPGVKEADLFAVPGNHDWYDGLTNFVKIFCQQRWIGSWKTRQSRSYFAIKLTNNTWLWAIDIQLEADIDMPQQEYFLAVRERMKKGDKVILCTAEPSWIYHTSRKKDPTYQNLEYFQGKFIGGKNVNNGKDGECFEQIATLAGDLHHYAHYAQNKGGDKVHHKFTAGGGGAFMHPTHNIPEKLINMAEGDYELKSTFPDKATSKNMAWKDFLFPFYNKGFGLFLAGIHLVFAWAIYISSSFGSTVAKGEGCKARPVDIFSQIRDLGASDISDVLSLLVTSFAHSPIAIFILVLFVLGFTKFCDTNNSKLKYVSILGAIHGFAHVVLMMFFLWFFTLLNAHLGIVNRVVEFVVFIVEIFIVGGGFAGALTGMYLFICNRVFAIHDNEAFSAMKGEGYKNFLRMHFKDNTLTIYPIGMKKTAHWEAAGNTFTTTDTLEPELIESPIIINLD